MLYKRFGDISLSRLGFGAMRLPLLADGAIDEAQVKQMVDHAIAHGINYFDTAYSYHDGLSEIVLGKALAPHPRGSFNLATKFPGHQYGAIPDPGKIFSEQLKKCGTDYFDFYLLHNVCENSLDTYMDHGVVEYFAGLRDKGLIRHLGFSSHAGVPSLGKFLDKYGSTLEFCQIQLNYLDWTLQEAEKKYALIESHGIPVWVMEPVRGGKLASLGEDAEKRLKAARPDENAVAWAFRWLMGLPNVGMILSGMSNLDQMRENIATFSEDKALSAAERGLLAELAEGMKNTVPCTACRYCCAGCPQQLDIPMLIRNYNDLKFQAAMVVSMQLETLPADKQPSACVGCGACAAICPQQIRVPDVMKDFAALLETMPKWVEICRQREEAAKRLAGK